MWNVIEFVFIDIESTSQRIMNPQAPLSLQQAAEFLNYLTAERTNKDAYYFLAPATYDPNNH